MLTVFVLIVALMFIGVITAIITGLVAISPIILVILLLPIVDIFIFRLIFRRKKK